MSSMVAQRLHVRHGRYFNVSPPMKRGAAAWGTSGATSSFSWPGEGGFDPRNCISVHVRVLCNNVCHCRLFAASSRPRTHSVSWTPAQTTPVLLLRDTQWTLGHTTSSGRGSRENCSASCERLSPSKCPSIGRYGGNVIPAYPNRPSSTCFKCRGVCAC
jgi:hypothetical protein